MLPSTELADQVLLAEENLKQSSDAVLVELEGIKKRARSVVKNTGTLQEHFLKVKKALLAFDLQKYQSKLGQDMRRLRTEWNTLHTKFKDNLNESRTFSTTVIGRIERYIDVLLPILQKEDLKDEEKLDSLNFFLRTTYTAQPGADRLKAALMEDETKAESICKQFKELAEEIDLYCENISHSLEEARQGTSKEVKTLKLRVADITQALNERKAMNIGIITGSLGILAPFAFLGAMLSRLIVSSCIFDRTYVVFGTEKKLDAAREALVGAEDRQAYLELKVVPPITDALDDSENICDALQEFAGIFRRISNDTQKIRENLEECLHAGAPFPYRQLVSNRVKEAYIKVSLSLRTYAENLEEELGESWQPSVRA